jgi:cell division protein FtsW
VGRKIEDHHIPEVEALVYKSDKLDGIMFVTTLLLVGLGIVMVYSSSVAVAELRYQAGGFFLKRHVLRALLGLLAMLVVMRIDYHRWQKLAGLGMLASIFLLVMVLLPKLAGNDGGANRALARRLHLPFVGFQPSELLKLMMVFYLARQLDRKEGQIADFKKALLPTLCVVGASLLLIAVEPDLGTALVIGMLVFTMFAVAGVRWVHLVGMGLFSAVSTTIMIIIAPYRFQRVTSFLKPDLDPSGAGYQIRQSLISLGSGGAFGVGLGNSRQKLLFLPEPHTDFVFSILGEELGFIGAVCILSLFLLLTWRGLKVARAAPDRFGFLLALGITATIFLNATLNVAVVTRMCPTTGLPLPFISYGGSSLLFNLIGMGVLLNISRQRRRGETSWRRRR